MSSLSKAAKAKGQQTLEGFTKLPEDTPQPSKNRGSTGSPLKKKQLLSNAPKNDEEAETEPTTEPSTDMLRAMEATATVRLHMEESNADGMNEYGRSLLMDLLDTLQLGDPNLLIYRWDQRFEDEHDAIRDRKGIPKTPRRTAYYFKDYAPRESMGSVEFQIRMGSNRPFPGILAFTKKELKDMGCKLRYTSTTQFDDRELEEDNETDKELKEFENDIADLKTEHDDLMKLQHSEKQQDDETIDTDINSESESEAEEEVKVMHVKAPAPKDKDPLTDDKDNQDKMETSDEGNWKKRGADEIHPPETPNPTSNATSTPHDKKPQGSPLPMIDETKTTAPPAPQLPSHKEAAAAAADDATVVASNASPVASIFKKMSGTARIRKNTVFYDLTIQIPASKKGMEATKKRCVEVYKALQDLDDRLILYATKQTHPKEPDACPSPPQLPSSMNKLGLLFTGLRARSDAGPVYVTIRIGYDDDVENFEFNMRTAMRDIEVFMKRKTIQTAQTKKTAWLFLAPDWFDTQEWADWFGAMFAMCDKSKGITREKKEMLVVGIKPQFIWSGTKKFEKNGTNDNRGNGKRGLHIEFVKGQEKIGMEYARRALQSEEFKARCNLPCRLIPLYQQNATRATKEKTQKAILRHAQAMASLQNAETDCCADIDTPSEELGGRSFRMLVLGMKHSGTNERLFYSMDRHWKQHDTFKLTFPDKFALEAQEVVKCLPKYLHHLHGDAIWKWITADAKAEAELQGWNETTQRPVTWEEKDLADAMSAADQLSWIDFSKPPPDNTKEANLQRPDKATDNRDPVTDAADQDAPVQLSAAVPGEVQFGAFDSNSLSTFGDGGASLQRTAAMNLIRKNPHQDDDDNASLISRVSVVEEDINAVKNDVATILKLLQAQQTPRSATTPNAGTVVTDDPKHGSAVNNS